MLVGEKTRFASRARSVPALISLGRVAPVLERRQPRSSSKKKGALFSMCGVRWSRPAATPARAGCGDASASGRVRGRSPLEVTDRYGVQPLTAGQLAPSRVVGAPRRLTHHTDAKDLHVQTRARTDELRMKRDTANSVWCPPTDGGRGCGLGVRGLAHRSR